MKTRRMRTQCLTSSYDVIYLELALRHNAMLATLDGRLTKAANSEGLFLVV